MSTDILEKVITSTQLGAQGGNLAPAQANRFIDYVTDETLLLKECRTERLNSDTAELDRMHVGRRLVRVATEAVADPVNANVTFSKVSITTVKLRLDWELSRESLEDNIEGEALEDHIARIMATTMGNDLEDLAVNGDGSSPDPLLKAFDGWRKLAMNNAHVVSAEGAGLGGPVFNAALKVLPREYKQRRNQLRFYAGSNLIQDYQFKLSQEGPESIQLQMLQGQGGAPGTVNNTFGYAFGIPIVDVPMFDETQPGTYTNADGTAATGEHGTIELTFPQNRVFGIRRDIQVYRQFIQKKDSIEYTVYTRIGVNVEDFAAYVVVTNVKVDTSLTR